MSRRAGCEAHKSGSVESWGRVTFPRLLDSRGEHSAIINVVMADDDAPKLTESATQGRIQQG